MKRYGYTPIMYMSADRAAIMATIAREYPKIAVVCYGGRNGFIGIQLRWNPTCLPGGVPLDFYAKVYSGLNGSSQPVMVRGRKMIVPEPDPSLVYAP